MLPYFQLMYAVWPLLSTTVTEKNEGKNRQIHRLIFYWRDASVDEITFTPGFQLTVTRARRFLRCFIDKTIVYYPELFGNYSRSKAMVIYLQMHLEQRFIPAFPQGRFNHHLSNWIDTADTTRPISYSDRLCLLLAEPRARFS